MPYRQFHSDLTLFPTPCRARDVYHPNIYRDHRAHPYSYSYHPRIRSSRRKDDYEERFEKSLQSLRDRGSDKHCAGDLGWTLEYATAWAYRNLNATQTEVADAIDRIREVDEGVEPETPFIIWDYLNRVLFGGKLRGMVYLRWKSLASITPGITSAAGVLSGIPKICVSINKTPFEDGEGHIDELLDALIHQMIHAYFLVACGAQPKGEKQDGRLMDGLHFGMILFTIKDITRLCRNGPLELIFYAHLRRAREMGGAELASRLLPNGGQRFIALNPSGSATAAAPCDGESHCCHDNRKIRKAQIRNWQVDGYSVALDLDMESKGETIFDLTIEGELNEMDRLKAPPSATYVELIWDGKRVMVHRSHALKYSSIKKPLEKEKKMELKIPDCDKMVFRHIYDFFNKGSYFKGAVQAYQDSMAAGSAYRRGPPVLTGRGSTSMESAAGVIVHLQVFKVAEGMKFEELQRYVLGVIWEMPTTDDDPIEVLKQLYNEKDNSGPIHAELHKWARHFLSRLDDGGYGHVSAGTYRGVSNLEKIHAWYEERFKDLYYRNSAFKDDCVIVQAQLQTGMVNNGYQYPGALPAITPASNAVATITDRAAALERTIQLRSALPRARSWYELTRPASSAASISSGSLDDLFLESPVIRQQRPVGIDWRRPQLALPGTGAYSYYGRDGRRKVRDALGDTYVRQPRSFKYEPEVYSF